jgi:hypothetical protein
MQNQSNATSKRSLKCLTLWPLLCVSLMLAACASVGGVSPQDQVRQRATERWQALVAREFSRAYNFNTPGFRAVVTPDRYRDRFGGAIVWLDTTQVVEVNCPEADRCLAKVRIDYKPVLSRSSIDKISTHVDETWLLQEGQWWYFQEIKGG